MYPESTTGSSANRSVRSGQLDNEGMIPKAWSAEELENEYRQFLLTDFSRTSFDLHRLYPSITNYRVYPGEVVVVIGDTGLGKTAFVQNLVVLLKMKTLWLSLENHASLQYRRYVQIAHEMSRDAVTDHYKQYTNTLSQAVSHITNVFATPELSAMRDLITTHDPRIVVVDTLDGIEVEAVRDPVTRVEKSIIHLKSLAQELNVIIIVVHHIPKSAMVDYQGNPKKLTKHSGRGSSSIEQKADKVLTIEGNEKDEIRKVRSVKARDEKSFTQYFHFNKETFRFTAIDAPPPSRPLLPTTRGKRLALRKVTPDD